MKKLILNRSAELPTLKVFGAIILAAMMTLTAHAVDVTLTLKPEQELNRIDEKVYGHFLEHIYHSVNGGLWGELVWNRSFEDNVGGGWSESNGVVSQRGRGEDQRFLFGNADWTDYEFTVEAQKTGGAEGFLILFRVQNDNQFSWANLGGWNNQQHGIERRGAGQNRQSVVGGMVNGSIESNKWYTIKVRCEGNNVKVSLDGNQILDITDPGMARAGRVGIGTWSTQAQFRNLKVTSLDGQTVLFNEVPKVAQQLRLRFWETSGDATFSLDSENAFNGRYCIKIESNGKTGTLSQSGYELKEGETYLVTFWVKSSSPNTRVVMEFRDTQQERIAGFSAGLGAPTNEWQKLPLTREGIPVTFNVLSPRDVSNATMSFNITSEGTVYIDQISIMPKSWAENGGFRPDLLQAIADLRPPVIRYPGGCYSSAYRWKDGIGPQEKRGAFPISLWDDVDVNSFGTDEFIKLCRLVGAEPLIVINTGTPNWNARRTPASADVDWLQEALDWLEYCNGPADSKWGKVRAENGHPEPYNVKYWEIDNEIESAVDIYIADIKKFVPAMKAMDPSIKIAVCGSWRGNRFEWDSTLINEVGELFDYLSFHQYDNPDLYADGPGRIETYFRSLKPVIDNSRNPNIKIYDSEWNAQSTDWRTGLYAGGILNVFERCGDFFEIGGPALFLRHASATAWDNAFINFDNKTWFPAPNYVVMKLWRDHYAPTRIGLDGDVQGLNLVATKSEDGKTLYLKAVNPTNEVRSVTLNIDGARAGGISPPVASLKLVTARNLRDRNTLENPNAIAPRDAEVKVEAGAVRFELPAYSAGVVTVK